MKREYFAGTVMIMLGFLLQGNMAFASQSMIQRFWVQHEQAKSGVINCWVNAESETVYEPFLQEIMISETNLLAYGVSPKDKRLVANLFHDNRKPVSMRKFAARVFLKDFRQKTRWEPEVKNIFSRTEFMVQPVKGANSVNGNHFKVEFE